jgi:chromosome segregation ATPase
LADLESRHTQDYGRLNEQTQALQQQSLTLLEQTQALQEQIDALERQGETTREAVDALQTRLATSESLLGEVQTALDTAQESLGALETQQAAFKPDITALRTALTKLETAVDDLTEATANIVSDVEALGVTLRDEAPLIGVRTDVQLLKAMELLTRARLQLSQDNLGLAATEVQEARTLLLDLSATIPAHQQDALEAIVRRLDLALANLPNAPRRAADDLEIAWQLLREGLPVQSTAETLLSPLATPPVTATETLTVTVPVTPTVTPTPRP